MNTQQQSSTPTSEGHTPQANHNSAYAQNFSHPSSAGYSHPPNARTFHHQFVLSIPVPVAHIVSGAGMPTFASPASMFSNIAGNMGGAQMLDPFLHVLQASLNQAGRGAHRPPSSAALESIYHIKVANGENVECPISAETIAAGEWASRMPCGHYFSKDSLSEWLKQHNTCPVCRYELHTGDEEYNRSRKLTPEAAAEASLQASHGAEDLIKIRIDHFREKALLDILEGALEEVKGEESSRMSESTSLQDAIKDPEQWRYDLCDSVVAELCETDLP